MMEEVFFLNPNNKNSSDRKKVLIEIISLIDNTKGLLRIAMAYFTYPDIANALIKRTKNGRATNLLLNTSDILRPRNINESEIVISKYLMELIKLNNPLEIQSLGFQSKKDYSNMHHKFIVSDKTLIFGSLNWTQSALHKNYEVVVLSDSTMMISKFIKEFDSLWKQSQPFFSSKGKIRMIMCPICKSSDGVDFESFGPFCLFCNHHFKVV
ncbi:MAG: phospholipase D-like domain-containing protein [Candidatus Thorarchaeota archaeon]